MNTSKKIGIVVAIIVIVIAIFALSKSGNPVTPDNSNATPPTSEANGTAPVAVSETSKVSGSLSEYQNAELGFSVKYPTTWEKEESASGVTFLAPIDKTQVSTVATLIGTIQTLPGTCTFPPVTSVKTRDTITVGDNTFKTITIVSSVKGVNEFWHLYNLQSSDICYSFILKTISYDPSRKNLTGSTATQAENNNKAIINTVDSQFTDLVKSFGFVTTPAGEDETKVTK